MPHLAGSRMAPAAMLRHPPQVRSTLSVTNKGFLAKNNVYRPVCRSLTTPSTQRPSRQRHNLPPIPPPAPQNQRPSRRLLPQRPLISGKCGLARALYLCFIVLPQDHYASKAAHLTSNGRFSGPTNRRRCPPRHHGPRTRSASRHP
jgi:hypothetical protein